MNFLILALQVLGRFHSSEGTENTFNLTFLTCQVFPRKITRQARNKHSAYAATQARTEGFLSSSEPWPTERLRQWPRPQTGVRHGRVQLWALPWLCSGSQRTEKSPTAALFLMCICLPAILFLKYINLIVSKPKRFNDPSLFRGRA